MIWHKAMKKPVIGIIMFSLFIMDSQTKNWWERYKSRFIPSPCYAVIDRIRDLNEFKEIILSCEDKILVLELKLERNIKENNNRPIADESQLKKYLYRKLANTYVALSKKANLETLKEVSIIQVNLYHPRIDINSYSTGEKIIILNELSSQEDILDHIERTIKIKESIK